MSGVVVLLCVLLQSTSLSLQIDIATSSATPLSLTRLASNLLKPGFIKLFQSGYHETSEWAEVVLDYTYSVPLSLQLLQAATSSLVICMYEGCPPMEISSRLSPRDVSESLGKVLTAFPFSNVFLLSTSNYQQVEYDLIARNPHLFSHTVLLNPNSDLPTALKVVGRMLKSAGTNMGVLLLDEISGANVITAMQEYNLLGEGFVYVSLQETVWRVMDKGLSDGFICIGDTELAETRNREEFEISLFKSQIAVLAKAENAGADSPGALQSLLTSTYSGKSRNSTAGLINIQQGSPRLVLSSTLIFPGNSSSFPNWTQALLPVSVNNEGLDFNGLYVPQLEIINRGFMVGYSEVNNRSDILPNFRFQVNSVGYGAVAFNTDWAVEQIQKNPKAVGLVHHPVALSQNVIGISEAFQRLNIQVPISTSAASIKLTDSKSYPMFVRTNPSKKYTVLAMMRFFNLFGWKKAAILISPSDEDLDFFECFKNMSSSNHINITNSHHTIPSPIEDAQDMLNKSLTEILASNTRIIIISHINPWLIFERMYDLGVRAGDYLIILMYQLTYTFFASKGEEFHKRRVVTKGAISFMMKLFVGEVGAKIESELQNEDGGSYFSLGCVFYDCSMLAAHALDYMIANGLYYERGKDLISAMRTTRFQGCIGRVQIESGTNDNLPGDQVIINMHYNEVNDTVELFTAAVYTSDRAVMFEFTGDLQWPNGKTYFPDSWETDAECPYLEKDIRDFPKGPILGLLACFTFSAITGIVTAIIWRKWWKVSFSELTSEHYISIEDVLVLISIPIDFLQFAAVGPDIDIISSIQNIVSFTSLSIESLINFTPGIFWGIEIAVFVMVLLYALLFLIKLLGLDEKLMDSFSFVDYVIDLLLPTFGNVLFLPIISTLLSTFNCYRSVGEDYTDSFLNRDCSEKCWSGKHLYYTSIAAACLVIYTPIAVFARPLWQYLQPNLHLQTLPLYLMLKSVLQMFLISASATLKFAYPTTHTIIYFILISAYLGFLLKFNAFNYARATLWHFLVVVALWLYALAGLLYWHIEGISPLILAGTLGGVYVCLAGVGVVLQMCVHKYRCLLKRKKGIDTSDIIKFAFTFGRLAQMHLANFRAKQQAARNADTSQIVISIST